MMIMSRFSFFVVVFMSGVMIREQPTRITTCAFQTTITTVRKKSQVSPSSVSSSSSLLSSSINQEESPSIAEQILHDFHRSKLSFRIIVIGNGAILESTSQLGPTFKTSISPKTGDRLVTFANIDASLEFHIKIDDIAKIVFVVSSAISNTTNNENQQLPPEQQSRRVARFMNANGIPICSLLLAESTKEGIAWFERMMETYGHEIVM